MSHLSKLFTEQKVDVPNRSGFDMSHENMGTMKVGTLTPVLCEEVLPNETYSLGHLMQVQLPPMATNFFGRIDCRLEAFFVPNRIVWGGWQNYMTMPQNDPYGTPVVRPTSLPSCSAIASIQSTQFKQFFGSGTLSDFLGLKQPSDGYLSGQTIKISNILPFLAYHKIYDDWYRNTKIQKPVFVRQSAGSNTQLYGTPWNPSTFNIPINAVSTPANTALFADGVGLFQLRQRNWAKDYFTTCSQYPQANGAIQGSIVETDGAVVDSVGDVSNGFSIAQLRQANVLQRWLERNNIAGERYSDQIKATWGVMPSDAMLDRAILLGSSSFNIYNKSVYQQSGNGSSSDTNKFNQSLGSKGADSMGLGKDSLIDHFTATEHGHIIVLASIVPHANYSTGSRRMFKRSEIGDFANPLLQGLGEQEVKVSELCGLLSSDEDIVFGYQQQYSEYKYHDDEVHGLLRDGENLENFCLQRSFNADEDERPVLSTDFIQIKTTALDQVTAVSSTLSQYGAWYDIFLSLKKVSPLSEYIIPTLGDLKNTHKESVPYRGRML